MNNERKYKFMPQKDTGRLSESDTKKYYSTLGFGVCAFLLAAYVAVIVASIICTKWFPWVIDDTVWSKIISMICQYGIGPCAMLVVLSRLPKDVTPKEKLSFKQFLGYLCICATFMTVGSNISSSVMSIIQDLLGKTVENPVLSDTSGTHWAINLVFYAIIAPIIEELVFRKMVCDRLLPLGEAATVFVSAALFGLIHGNFYQFFYAFLVGAIFSYIYIKTGNLLCTTVIHMIINALGGVLAPWALDEMVSLLTEENIALMAGFLEKADFNGYYALIAPYALPFGLLAAYSIIMNVCSIIGFVLLMKNLRKIRFTEGLLRPAEEHKISNFFMNGGICAAIAMFTGMFLISLFEK